MPNTLKPQMDLYLCILLSAALSYSSAYAQSNEAYLNALKGEASGLTLDTATETQTTANPALPPSEPTLSINNNSAKTQPGMMPKGLTMDQFLAYIKKNYFGTYIFMKRLKDPKKQEIYNFYTQNNDPQAIRAKVLSTSKKK